MRRVTLAQYILYSVHPTMQYSIEKLDHSDRVLDNAICEIRTIPSSVLCKGLVAVETICGYDGQNKYIYMGGLALMVISQKKWEFFPFFMSTLGIIQPHLKSFSDFI